VYRIGKEEIKAVERVIRSRQLFRYGEPKQGHLQEVAKFEKELAKKTGSKYALAVTSGTAALTCALTGMGIGPGDEVIVPAYTFVATAISVLSVGAIPVLADIDDTLTLDPDDFERKITKRTRAVIPVYMVGFPADMGRIMRIAGKHRIAVLEDVCQADGGSYHGKRLGSIGRAGVFSFNFYKIISCGEGGAVVTDDIRVFHRAMIYHDGGIGFRPHGKNLATRIFSGTNYRLNEILGAIMRIQLRRMDLMLKSMRRQKKIFMRELSGHPSLEFIRSNDIEGDCCTHIGFVFEDKAEAKIFSDELNKHKIGCYSPYYSGRHIYPNWEVVMMKRGAHHPLRDPYRLQANKTCRMDYTRQSCSRTLEILARTVLIPTHPDHSEKELYKRIKACDKAGQVVLIK